jgi:hypothetical protein
VFAVERLLRRWEGEAFIGRNVALRHDFSSEAKYRLRGVARSVGLWQCA